MKIVMGELNGQRLIDLLRNSEGRCTMILAAVAYATKTDPFFEHCAKHSTHLEYYGLLDEGAAVSIPVLEHMLRAGPMRVSPRLVKGHFHSKIIWWRGYGVYIGSANLTSNAWFTNVECGVFFEEEEISGNSIEADLQIQFDYLFKVSRPVTAELIKDLDKLRLSEATVYRASEKLKEQFDQATKGFPTHLGLTSYGPTTTSSGYIQFASEWNETLELIRGLSREFHKLGARPKWVSASANQATHFDQFLHAYYYVKVREELSDEESSRSLDQVNRAYETNKNHKADVFEGALEWWSNLSDAPYGEDTFIASTAPRMREAFAESRLHNWTLDDFKETFFDVHAFKAHARQIPNSTFGLPVGHKESIRQRSDRAAEWLWKQERKPSERTVLELLQFLMWSSSPTDMTERLWIATREPGWRFNHFGRSSLGEAIGWARPDKFPPRNNRTNKALRALGHDIRLFSGN